MTRQVSPLCRSAWSPAVVHLAQPPNNKPETNATAFTPAWARSGREVSQCPSRFGGFALYRGSLKSTSKQKPEKLLGHWDILR